MKMQKTLVLVGLMALFLGCGTSQKIIENNDALDDMMAQKKIEFKMRSAHPMVTNAMSQIGQSGLLAPGNNINRIDLSGSANFLKIMGDSVSANLAYYGERQLGGGYNNRTGIEFKGIPDTIEILQDDKKKGYTIKFRIREQMESFTVSAHVSSNLSGSIGITSSHRTRITYLGTATALQKEQ